MYYPVAQKAESLGATEAYKMNLNKVVEFSQKKDEKFSSEKRSGDTGLITLNSLMEVGFPDVSWVSVLHVFLGLNDIVKLWSSFKLCSKTNVFADMVNKKIYD